METVVVTLCLANFALSLITLIAVLFGSDREKNTKPGSFTASGFVGKRPKHKKKPVWTDEEREYQLEQEELKNRAPV